MARIIWKGAISFSLIHIPVSLHPASRANELDLDLLDRRDFSPVGYQRINKSTGKVVEWDDIVKGYQYRKGEYVALTDEDFRRANVAATQTIAIQAFVKQHEIPPQYFETPYYLAPDKRGQKVYALLREAMRESGRWAIGSVVVRTRAYACALIPQDELLVLNTLRYADEIRPADAIEAPASSVRKAGVSAQGVRSCAQARRRHVRHLGPGPVQGHVPRRSAETRRGKGKEGADTDLDRGYPRETRAPQRGDHRSDDLAETQPRGEARPGGTGRRAAPLDRPRPQHPARESASPCVTCARTIGRQPGG